MRGLFYGWLRQVKGLHPDQGLPGVEGPVDPGYGIEEGHPDQGLPPLPGAPDNELPAGPPGIWPPLSPGHPAHPLPPTGTVPPPGAIWPPVNGGAGGNKYVVVAGIPGVGWRYVVVDPGAHWPVPPTAAPK